MYQHANKIFRKGWEMHISPIKKTWHFTSYWTQVCVFAHGTYILTSISSNNNRVMATKLQEKIMPNSLTRVTSYQIF